jgi:hypothetical protein
MLWLPTGGFDGQDDGRLLCYLPVRLHHELMGFLVGRGLNVAPLNYRCPFTWREGSSIETILALWAAEFVSASLHLLFQVTLPLSSDPRIYLPLANVAMDGAMFWADVHAVATAVFAYAAIPAAPFRAEFKSLARLWEQNWNRTLPAASPAELARDTRAWVLRCDTHWRNVLKEHQAALGYSFANATLVRML